jgi:hypothetical protein
MNRTFTIASNKFDKVAQRRKPKSRKVAEGRTKSRNVACNRGNLQVQDRPTVQSVPWPMEQILPELAASSCRTPDPRRRRSNSALADFLWTVPVHANLGFPEVGHPRAGLPSILLALPIHRMVSSLCGILLDGSAILLMMSPAKLRSGVLPSSSFI